MNADEAFIVKGDEIYISAEASELLVWFYEKKTGTKVSPDQIEEVVRKQVIEAIEEGMKEYKAKEEVDSE